VPEIINRQTAADQVAEVLREKILSGELPAGQYIRQEAIAQELGVSRLPVREALVLLESQGLVQTEKYKGTFVASLSMREIEEIYALRGLLETFLLRRAFPNLDEQIFEQAEQIIERSKKAKNLAEWAELNWQFHTTLYEPAHLDLTLKTLEQVLIRADRYLRLQRTLSAKLRASSDEQHAHIIELLRAGKCEDAIRAMGEHIEWNMEDMGKTIAQIKQSAAPAGG
jgi:DNA-binding GntR family transcriptional regulator